MNFLKQKIHKIFIPGILLVSLLGCKSPDYLPYPETIGINSYGSRISITKVQGPKLKGELIAIDTTQLIVLADKDYIKRINEKITAIPVKEIKRFRLKYARPKPYIWPTPVYTLATAGHGWFAFFSAPVNLVVTIMLDSGVNAFQYNEIEMTYEKLKMFARFPQGIPDNIDKEDIK